MIFISVGTHEQPFDRAIGLAGELALAGERVIVQHGFTRPDPHLPNAEWYKFVDYAQFVALIGASTAFVCHAGVGSVLTALGEGRVPIVLPRETRYGEHLDDHQVDLAKRLAERDLLVLAEESGIFEAIRRSQTMAAPEVRPAASLSRAVSRAASC